MRHHRAIELILAALREIQRQRAGKVPAHEGFDQDALFAGATLAHQRSDSGDLFGLQFLVSGAQSCILQSGLGKPATGHAAPRNRDDLLRSPHCG